MSKNSSSDGKISQKDLKKPDSFQVAAATGFKYFEENRKLLILCGGVIVALAVVAIGVKYFKDSQRESLRAGLAVIDKEYRGEDKEFETALKELQDKIDKKEQEKQTLVGDLAKESDPDKKKEISAKIDQLTKDLTEQQDILDDTEPKHGDSLQKFFAFYQKHQDKPEGLWAGMRYVGYLISEKKYAEAEPILKNVIEKSKELTIYQIQARFMLLTLLENQHKDSDALAQANTLLDLVSDDLKPKVMLAKSRYLLAQKETDQAKELLDKIIKGHGTSREAGLARSYKALLND